MALVRHIHEAGARLVSSVFGRVLPNLRHPLAAYGPWAISPWVKEDSGNRSGNRATAHGSARNAAHPPIAGPEYERYLLRLLAHYVPPDARGADTVLDAMCGFGPFANLAGLRKFFADATLVQGCDIKAKRWMRAPAGSSVYFADLQRPLPTNVRYSLITLFKPLGQQSEFSIQQALGHLVAKLHPGGHLLIVLAEQTDVGFMLEAVSRLSLSLRTSEANVLRINSEPEHKWVIVCRVD